MITELHWCTDISKAPKGENVERVVTYERNGKQEQRRWEDFVPTKILALTNCGKVVSTYWVPEKRTQSGAVLSHGHWSGFPERPEFGGGPVMWAAWPVAPVLAREAAE
jgi:hypothetical protein